jgi:hypothetical protein
MLPLSVRHIGPIDGLNLRGLLDQAVEELTAGSRGPAVEAEGELVQVLVEMAGSDSTLMGAEKPPLEQRGDEVDTGHDLMAELSALADVGDLVPETIRGQPTVALPAVGVNNRAGFDALLHEAQEVWARGIVDRGETDSSHAVAIFLGSHGDQGLRTGSASSYPFLFPSHVSLVHLDPPRESVSVRPNHRPPQLVKHCPDRLVSLHTELTLKAQRANPTLLARDQPHRAEPQSQWETRAVEDGSRRRRNLVMAVGSFQHASPRIDPRMARPAARAAEPLGPPKPREVLPASVRGSESSFELKQGGRIVFPVGHGRYLGPRHYILWSPESTGYP